MNAKALQTALDMLGNDLPKGESRATIAVYTRTTLKTKSKQVLLRPMPSDAAVAAHELFSVLREFDDAGVKLIWVETPPDDGTWDGVRDRLQRASA
jgi:L-threonylcarbamoyladenylate synthase